jgi:hypothetical protein
LPTERLGEADAHAMDLDGAGADPELVRDRLVLLAADEEVYDLMLAGSE